MGILFDSSPTEPTTLEEVIGQAIGAASVCWETPQGAGVFDSTRAKELLDEVVEWIETNYRPTHGATY